MDRLAKLWVGKILHRKYDHNWIKKRENYDSLPKGFSFEFPISLNHLKKFPTIRPLILSGLSTYLLCITFLATEKWVCWKFFSLAFKLAYFYVAPCNLTIPQFNRIEKKSCQTLKMGVRKCHYDILYLWALLNNKYAHEQSWFLRSFWNIEGDAMHRRSHSN